MGAITVEPVAAERRADLRAEAARDRLVRAAVAPRPGVRVRAGRV